MLLGGDFIYSNEEIDNNVLKEKYNYLLAYLLRNFLPQIYVPWTCIDTSIYVCCYSIKTYYEVGKVMGGVLS